MQIFVITILVVGAAFSEAIVPLWTVTRFSNTQTDVIPNKEYGTLFGWKKCITPAPEDEFSDAANNTHSHCNNTIARYYPGTLLVTASSKDEPSSCTGGDSDSRRGISGKITNTSDDVYLSSVSWRGSFDRTDSPISSSASMTLWLGPHESKSVCLFSLQFQNAEEANIFDANADQLVLKAMFERGVEG